MNRNILITGGELYNKGAQSMTFITVDRLRQKFPDHNIILLSSMDAKREEHDRKQYNFKILEDIFKVIFLNGIYAKFKGYSKEKVFEYKNILKNTDMLIDISGYALGSNWNLNSTIHYLTVLNNAAKYNIDVYLMPQSYGPFDYNPLVKWIINPLLKRNLNYPIKIYARENEGFNLLRQNFKLDNISVSPDLVLLNDTISLENIFKEKPIIKSISIKNNSIAIVPNMKNFMYGSREEILNLYKKIIEMLIEKGVNVYLIRHSFEDIEACILIKELFENEENVVLVSEEFSCIDYDELVVKFNYLIASRYHSIIHAYKNNIPCISLGWATKYYELLSLFEQDNYIFDVRESIDTEYFIKKLEKMNANFQVESNKIEKNLKELQSNNIFDVINSDL